MMDTVRRWLKRPLAEDFSFRNQGVLSLQGGLYVFLFLFFWIGRPSDWPQVGILFLLGLGCVLATLVANWLVPKILPRVYDEEQWTIGRHLLHTLFVLLCISLANQSILYLIGEGRPSFWVMYAYVTLVGFFPITLGVLIMERRRLKRYLEHARTANERIDQLHQPAADLTEAEMPAVIDLVASSGKERLSLLPNQLLYLESTANYVEIHYLNFMFPQQTTLRSTLKEMETALAEHPQVFRCHRAFIVNLKAVQQVEGNARGYQLTMSGSERQIPVSRSYLEAFDRRMRQLA